MEEVRGRGGLACPRGPLNEGQPLIEGSIDGGLLRTVEVRQVWRLASLQLPASDVGAKPCTVVDVQDIPQQHFSQHRPSIAFR